MPLRVSGDYAYKILAGYAGYHDEIRLVLGVTVDELTDAEIDSLPCAPAADAKVTALVPDYASRLEDINLILAVMYFTAANIIRSFKNKLAQRETDNKTEYQRFADAFEQDYEAMAWDKLEDVIPGITGDSASLLSLVKPSIDAITGESQ